MPTFLRPNVALIAAAALCAACANAPRDAAVPAAPGDGHSGMKAYIDPETGEFTDRAPEGTQPPEDPGLAAEADPLEERDAPGGGKMVDLEGRYRAQSEDEGAED
jgi:hypothetical protein